MVTRCARQFGGRICRSPTASKWCSIRIWREAFDWQPLLHGVDQVVHLAGIAHTKGADAASYDRINRLATARLATAAAQARVEHFVFISSIRAQSGPAADHALTERDPPAPTDAYGASKLAAEDAVRSSGVPFTILRPVLVYGPGVKGNLALLARAAASRLPLPVKDFANRRSLLGIDNFISALAFVLATPATIGETYVVADPGIPPRLSDVFVNAAAGSQVAARSSCRCRRPISSCRCACSGAPTSGIASAAICGSMPAS